MKHYDKIGLHLVGFKQRVGYIYRMFNAYLLNLTSMQKSP